MRKYTNNPIKNNLKLIGFSLLLFLTINLPGQDINFKRFVPPEGISMNGLISGITQDSRGHMWFSGPALYRYDGYELKVFLNDPSNPNSLASNSLESICAGKDGIVWIGTSGFGLDRYDPETGIFTHFRHDPEDASSISHNKITALRVDSDGDLWIGTHGGLNRYDRKTDTFHRYRHNSLDSNSLSCDQVRYIYEDRARSLWIGTGSPFMNDDTGPNEGGLNRLDKKTGQFTRYLNNPIDSTSLIDNRVGAIFEDSRGTFWVGTAGDGLHTMNREKGTFTRHLHHPLQPNKLSRPPVSPNYDYDHIHFITQDAVGYIWIGTVGAGLNRYDPITQQVTHYKSDKNPNELNTSWQAFNSQEGVLWISEWWGELYYHDPLEENIPFIPTNYRVECFFEEDAEKLWLGTTAGLLLKNQRTGNITKILEKELSNTERILPLYIDKQQTLWFGANNGLCHFNPKTQDFSIFKPDENNINSISGPPKSVLEDKNGLFWIATQGGLDVFDGRNNKFTHYSALQEDIYGNLWVGAFKGGGINLLNRSTNTFKHYLLGTTINFLYEDSDNRIWAGTDGGFFQYDNAQDEFILFNDPEKNIDTRSIYVNSIVEDGHKNLWMSTSLGFLELNASRNRIRIFGSPYGINPSGLGFSAGHKGLDGKIYFGDTNGYYHFFPDSLSSNLTAPQIVFSDFRINNEPIRPTPDGPIKVNINEVEEIALNHTQAIFSLEFAGIHYSNTKANKHLYMLENYDSDWRQSGTEHTAYYYNVPPGQYRFRVKAANSNGIWAEKSVKLSITPPWWLTNWAYLLYALLFVTAIHSVNQFQKNRLVKIEREKARERELAQSKEIAQAYHELKSTQAQLIQAEKMASLGELTAGIAHEIQNPLNFVNNFSEVSGELLEEMKEELVEGNMEDVQDLMGILTQNLGKINHHGQRASGIVKGMLAHSRSRSTTQKEATDLNSLCAEYLRLAYHGFRAKNNRFNAKYKLALADNLPPLEIVRQDLSRVILNLINNAFYAVHEKAKDGIEGYEPKVVVRTEAISPAGEESGMEKVVISVTDNGKGIPQANLDKIFQPFFTTKPTGQGTGLGLSLSYDIITNGHGGALTVATEEGEGTTFKIVLPKRELQKI